MDAMKGASEDEGIIRIELLQAWRKRAVVYESTSLVYDEESEYNPL